MMVRILDLLSKDLSQVIRDKRSFLILVAMPIAFTLFMGVTIGLAMIGANFL